MAVRVRGDGVADCAGGMRRADIDGAHGGAKPDGGLRRGVGACVGGSVCNCGAAVGDRGHVHSEVDGEINQPPMQGERKGETAMTIEEIAKILADHAKWLRGEPDGQRADFRGADLRGANIDYSCWPLWCGSLDVVVDRRIAAQLAYHFCRLICDDPDYIAARNAVVDFANTFHRVNECGALGKIEVPDNAE